MHDNDMTLSEYLIEAVSHGRKSRKYSKYEPLTMDDLKPGMKVGIKANLDDCDIIGYTANTGDPIVGDIVITKAMQWWMGNIVTVEEISTRRPGFKPVVFVEENVYTWPVEMFEKI